MFMGHVHGPSTWVVILDRHIHKMTPVSVDMCPCSWPVLMARAHGPCSWPVFRVRVYGPCSRLVFMAHAHGPCSWPVFTARVQCSWPVLMARVPVSWPVFMARVHVLHQFLVGILKQ